MDIVASIGQAIDLVTRLREVSKNVAEAEFRNLLADLSNELADAKLEAASLKEKIANLKEENRILKETKQPSEEKPIGTKWGCYQFNEDDGLYCTACWDSKRMKSRTNRVDSGFRSCPVCGAKIGSS